MRDIRDIIIDRYRDLIEEKEQKTVSELRQLIDPHSKLIKQIADSLKDNSIDAVVSYLSSFKTIEIPITFYLTFEEFMELNGGAIMDKALFAVSLLRALSYNSKVFITDKNIYVLAQELLFIDPDSWTIYRGKDVQEIISREKPLYSFNDLSFDSFED